MSDDNKKDSEEWLIAPDPEVRLIVVECDVCEKLINLSEAYPEEGGLNLCWSCWCKWNSDS